MTVPQSGYTGSSGSYGTSDTLPTNSSSTTEKISDAASTASSAASDVASTAASHATDLASSAKDQASDVASTAKDQASTVIQEAKGHASSLASQAQSEIAQQLSTQKTRLAQVLEDFASDLQEMSSSRSGTAADLVSQASERVRSVGTYVRENEASDVLDSLRSYASRRPGAFLLGASALGLLVGRGVKAGRSLSSESSDSPSKASETSGYAGGYSSTNTSAGVLPQTSTPQADTSTYGSPAIPRTPQVPDLGEAYPREGTYTSTVEPDRESRPLMGDSVYNGPSDLYSGEGGRRDS